MKKPPHIAELRHRVTIQYLTDSRDDQGGRTRIWADHATLWAKVEEASLWEQTIAQSVRPAGTHKMTIRYLETLTESMRVIFAGKTFQIKAIAPLNNQKFWMFVSLEEGKGT